MKLTKRCDFNGKIYQMDLPITQQQFDSACRSYANGALIQDAFHLLNAGEREFVMTGTTPQVWDEMFGRSLFSSKPVQSRHRGSEWRIDGSARITRTGRNLMLAQTSTQK